MEKKGQEEDREDGSESEEEQPETSRPLKKLLKKKSDRFVEK